MDMRIYRPATRLAFSNLFKGSFDGALVIFSRSYRGWQKIKVPHATVPSRRHCKWRKGREIQRNFVTWQRGHYAPHEQSRYSGQR